MFRLLAINKITREEFSMGEFSTHLEAVKVRDHDIEWDPEDDPTEWGFTIEQFGDEDCEDWEEYDSCDYEVGYNPYCGCYTDDC